MHHKNTGESNSKDNWSIEKGILKREEHWKHPTEPGEYDGPCEQKQDEKSHSPSGF